MISSLSQPCPTLCDPMDCSPPGSSDHGLSQARMLEWAATSCSRGSSRPPDQDPYFVSGAGMKFSVNDLIWLQQQVYDVGAANTPISQMVKLKHRKGRPPPQGHTASQPLTQDSFSDCMALEPGFLCKTGPWVLPFAISGISPRFNLQQDVCLLWNFVSSLPKWVLLLVSWDFTKEHIR